MKKKWCGITLLMLSVGLFTSTIVQAEENPNEAVVIQLYKMRDYNGVIEQLYADKKDSHSPDITSRILADSSIFMGKPYYLGALGEGHVGKFDKDPLYRTDKFDCVTLVSTVLALVESDNFNQFRDHVLDIRYVDGLPSYLNRNHFTSVDWNLNNQKHGYITDYTKILFPKTYKAATATIDKPGWYQHLKANNLKQFRKLDARETSDLLAKLHALGKQTKIETSHLAYEPLVALFDKDGKPKPEMFAKIPSGVIIEIIRPNWDIKKLIGTNLNVSHLGLGVRINGKLYFREASSITQDVVDIPLEKYLVGYLNSTTVKGINIQLINYPQKKRL